MNTQEKCRTCETCDWFETDEYCEMKREHLSPESDPCDFYFDDEMMEVTQDD